MVDSELSYLFGFYHHPLTFYRTPLYELLYSMYVSATYIWISLQVMVETMSDDH